MKMAQCSLTRHVRGRYRCRPQLLRIAPRIRSLHDSSLLSLKISDPMILINNVASRYLSPSRIIIEFVDNSIDDMETCYCKENNAYARLVKIKVHINSKKNYVRVVDNANGMSADMLTRLVSNIGDSSKRNADDSAMLNVNGRFGFGMQSFRAAAHRLTIVSCQGATQKIHKMSFTREQAADISPPCEISRDSRREGEGEGEGDGDLFPEGSGTNVLIEQWKEDWLTGFGGAKKLHEQLQRHFERLLHRKNIELCVIDDVKNVTYKCLPMDYNSLLSLGSGEGLISYANEQETKQTERKDGIIQRRVYLTGRQQKEYVDIFFVILTPKQNRKEYPVNLFCNGRRVSSARYLKSFMRKSKNAWIWNHPCLVGYVDASCLTPVITRDEFKKNAARNKVYQVLYTIEAELSTRLDNHAGNYIQSDETFHKLEGVINNALSLVVREEKYEKKSYAEHLYSSSEDDDGNKRESECSREHASLLNHDDTPRCGLRTAEDEVPVTTLPPTEPLVLTDTPVPAPPTRQPDTSLARGVGLGVKFVKNLENNRRAKLVGSYIEINVTHPDFETRVSSKNGAPRLTERLLGYIANVVSAAYRSSVHTSSSHREVSLADSNNILFEQDSISTSGTSGSVYDEMLDTIVESSTRLEEKLQKKLPALQKEIDQMVSATFEHNEDFRDDGKK